MGFESILLKNVQAITLDEENRVLKDCFIGIRDGKIDYMGLEQPEENQYQRVMECAGCTAMPGLVNAHNHAAMTLFRNYADDMKLMDWLFTKIFPLEDKLTEDAAYWASQLAIVEMLKSGTTTFSDMYFFMHKTAEAVAESGIRAALSRGLQGDSGLDEMDYRLQENIELYKQYHNSANGRIKVMFGPHSVYTCTVPYLQKVAAKSNELNIPIQIHLSETKDEVGNCIQKHGMSPVKLLEKAGLLKETTLAAHCVVVDREDIEILAKRKVHVAHNPGSNLKLASGMAPVVEMQNAGVNVCLGTDGASSNNNLDLLEEIRMAAYLQKVRLEDPTALPVDHVLEMATVNGAKALGFSNTGRLKTGMAADIILLNTEKAQYYPKYNIKSAVAYSGSSADVETVIVDGRVLMEKGSLLTLDEEKILFEAQKWAEIITA